MFGRWRSDVVDRYVREIPLQITSTSHVMMRGYMNGIRIAKPGVVQNERVLVPDATNNVWIQGVVTKLLRNGMVEVESKTMAAAESLIVMVESKKWIRL